MESALAQPTAAREAGCGFFSRTPDKIFTPEDFKGEEALMIQAASEFSRKEVFPVAEALDHQEEGLMPSLIRKAGALGFCGVDSPEAYGGLGLGKNLAARILEFLSLNASFSVTVGVTSGISQVGLSWFGTDEQKKKYLPQLTSGEWIGAYALSEPNSGSDALSATTRADKRGNKYILNGTKMWISNAKWAEFFLVMAKVDGERFSAFLVERDFPGLEIAREEHKMGLKGSSTARVILDNCEVPVENLLYEEGKGHQVALNALNLGRFKLSSMSIGPLRSSIELASAYVQDRKQFGEQISNFGLIRKKLALMAMLQWASEAMIYRTGEMIDGAFAEWGGTIEGNKKAAEEYSVECSMCKVFSTEAESMAIDEALQCYGGYGFTEEFPIARNYRDARVSRIYEGTNEINRVFIGTRLLRRIGEGRTNGAPADDSFVAELTGRALKAAPKDQVGQGALSDLLMYQYAEQSARLRSKHGGLHADMYGRFLDWLQPRAVEAYQAICGDAIMIPASTGVGVDAIAEAVLSRRLP
jgi:alkylation response protein AidB-like acyl-CoA dehydrogenase